MVLTLLKTSHISIEQRTHNPAGISPPSRSAPYSHCLCMKFSSACASESAAAFFSVCVSLLINVNKIYFHTSFDSDSVSVFISYFHLSQLFYFCLYLLQFNVNKNVRTIKTLSLSLMQICLCLDFCLYFLLYFCLCFISNVQSQ